MNQSTVYYVGTPQQVQHHAQPLAEHLDVCIASVTETQKKAKPGDLAIFYSEHFSNVRRAIFDLKRRNVATLYAIDGILEWRNAWENRPDEPACPWTMRPAVSHKVACIGESQARVLRSWGEASKVEIVGIPRFDRLRNLDGDSKRVHQISGGPFRILVMTAKYPGFTPQQRGQIRQSLVDLKNWIDDQNESQSQSIEVVWRLTGGLDREIGVSSQIRNTTGGDLATALSGVDVVVTTPSTAQLEAMLMGKPTAILDYTNSPRYVDAAWVISAPNQIADVVGQLRCPPPARIHYQNHLLHDSLFLESSATERMVLLVEQMTRQASEAVGAGRAVQFDSSLLPPASPHLDSIPMAEMYPGYRAFEIDDAELLRLELAQTERTLRFREQTIEELRKELEQAHAVFDSIHEHPIAGPIVRTRQRVLDWLGHSGATSKEGN